MSSLVADRDSTDKIETDVEQAAELPLALDERRRPGRTDVSPELVELLRTPPQPSDDIVEDQGNPGRGFVIAGLISLPIWALLIAAGRWLFW
jgi:hypothetical protein